MTRIIEIEDGTRCLSCQLSVGVGGEFFCPMTSEKSRYSQECNQGTDDEEFVKRHDLYKELLARCEELEAKLEEKG